jgi:hypothetical protein
MIYFIRSGDLTISAEFVAVMQVIANVGWDLVISRVQLLKMYLAARAHRHLNSSSNPAMSL